MRRRRCECGGPLVVASRSIRTARLASTGERVQMVNARLRCSRCGKPAPGYVYVARSGATLHPRAAIVEPGQGVLL